jgi:CRP/FNR family transcriptional regulator, cyclic AMP receptor protein
MRGRRQHREMLGQVPLFQGLSQTELGIVMSTTQEVRFEPGEEIVREGDLGAGFHLILEGTATVLRGKRKVRTLGPGDSFGDIALIDGGHRTATVRADSALHTLSVASWHFKPLLLEHPQIAFKLLVQLCRRLREAESRAAI